MCSGALRSAKRGSVEERTLSGAHAPNDGQPPTPAGEAPAAPLGAALVSARASSQLLALTAAASVASFSALDDIGGL